MMKVKTRKSKSEIHHRFRAFERLLSDFPEFLERVMLLQVIVVFPFRASYFLEKEYLLGTVLTEFVARERYYGRWQCRAEQTCASIRS